jgi:hypothetical protein
MNKISPTQIKLIHIAKQQLGLSDEEYRELLRERYMGCFEGSCKELTYQEAHDLIEHFKSMGFEIKKRRRKKPRGMDEIVHSRHPMMLKIEHLRKDIHWHVKHDGFQRLLEKRFGIKRIKTTREAVKVMECLKAMKARQEKKAPSTQGAECSGRARR